MDCNQYKIVCQVKYEVMAITNTVQMITLQNVQNGRSPAPEFSKQYAEKLQKLQEVLNANRIHQENFNLTQFATECLQNADIQMNNYINTYGQTTVTHSTVSHS